MAGTPGPEAHLSDADIDAYWLGQLPSADEERVEQHYLQCADCRQRVETVESMIEGLRAEAPAAAGGLARARTWQLAAAVLAMTTAAATWQWTRLAREPEAAPAQTAPGSSPTAIVPLAPPTRDAQRTAVKLLPGVAVVVFELDATEGGAPGSRFDITLGDRAGREILRMSGVSSSPTGVIRIPVERSLVGTGEFAIRATGHSGTIDVPFLIQEPDSR